MARHVVLIVADDLGYADVSFNSAERTREKSADTTRPYNDCRCVAESI